MKPSILGIQFRKNQNSTQMEQKSIEREVGICTSVDFISALDETHDWEEPEKLMGPYAGLILGGSGDFDFDGGRSQDDEAKLTSYAFLERLRPLLDYIFERDVPTFGICYGHQILGAFAGAQVGYDQTQRKSCSHVVEFSIDKTECHLFKGVPDTFFAHYAHKDALDRIPDGATLLLHGGEACKVAALRYKANIYSTQFHPELNFVDLLQRMQAAPQYLPEGVKAEDVFKDDPHSNTILRNFGQFVAENASFTISE